MLSTPKVNDPQADSSHESDSSSEKLLCQIKHQHFSTLSVDPSKSPIFVQAPRELQYSELFVQAPHELQYSELMVWRLKRQLYGLRDAPKSWQAHFSQIMINKGITKEWFEMKSDSHAPSSRKINWVMFSLRS